MGLLAEWHQAQESALARSVAQCRDAKETADALRAHWAALRAEYMQQAPDERTRERAAPLFDALLEGVSAVGAMTETRIERRKLPTVALPAKPSLRALARRYAVPALGVLASAVCILSGETLAALLTLASAAAMGFDALRRSEPAAQRPSEEIITAVALPDQAELLTRVRRSVGVLDQLLTRAARRDAAAGEPAQTLMWTRQSLESVQQLWEAYEDEDGAYALKAVPMLLSELAGQQVTLRRYGEGADEHFDLLPGLIGGKTIRPAIFSGERLLLRGQATCEAEKVEVIGL